MENTNLLSKTYPSQTLLGIDFGTKFIGLALRPKDTPSLILPLDILENNSLLIKKFQSLMAEEQVDILVLGLPLHENDQWSQQAESTFMFFRQIETLVQKRPVFFQNEFLSSFEASARGDESLRRNSKKRIDDLAAVVILEDFLRSDHPKDLDDVLKKRQESQGHSSLPM